MRLPLCCILQNDIDGAVLISVADLPLISAVGGNLWYCFSDSSLEWGGGVGISLLLYFALTAF